MLHPNPLILSIKIILLAGLKPICNSEDLKPTAILSIKIILLAGLKRKIFARVLGFVNIDFQLK